MYSSERLKDNENIVFEAIKQNVRALHRASKRFQRLMYDINFLKQFQYEAFPANLTNLHHLYNTFAEI